MKFLSLLSLASSTAAAAHDWAWFETPSEGDILTIGSEVTIDIANYYPSGPLETLGMYIAITGCGNSPCQTWGLGQPIYIGAWEWQGETPAGGELYENFTVTIPRDLVAGTGNLTATCVYINGGGDETNVFMETIWTTVVLESPSA